MDEDRRQLIVETPKESRCKFKFVMFLSIYIYIYILNFASKPDVST